MDILNSTIAFNGASAIGGGIWTTGPAPSITNTIVANNTATAGPDVSGTVISLGHNLIGDGAGSTGFGATGDQVGVDPLLGPLADHGGPTWTCVLLADSPAIDGAETSSAPAVDQRGIARPYGAAADIGAYERTGDDDPVVLVLDAGGPYYVPPGGTVVLSGSAEPPEGAVSFAWDFQDEDVLFDDATGPTPVFSAAGIPDGTEVTVTLQVTATDGQTHTDTATVYVDSSVVVLTGTEGDDVIDVDPGTAAAGTNHVVEINGVVHIFAPAITTALLIDGLGGTDTIVIHGTDQDETVTLVPGMVQMAGETYHVTATNAETVTVNAGTGDDDRADMTGSAGSNRLYSYPDYTLLADSAHSYYFRAEGFDTVTADSAASWSDYAFMYDSGGTDVLNASLASVVLNRADGSTEMTAIGFERTYVYSTSGGVDEATLSGAESAGNQLYGYAGYSLLTNSTRSFYFYAHGFQTVTGTSPGGGISYAYLYDGPDFDLLTASPASATMNRNSGDTNRY